MVIFILCAILLAEKEAMGGASVGGSDGGLTKRRGCSCTKDDFLPEESFRTFWNYLNALEETPMRLRDRVLARSLDSTELLEVKARSQHEMKKTLSWWDLIWFGIGAVIGSGIFVLTGLEARDHAGPAVVLSYVVSGVSAMLSVFCYTEFAVEIPVAGTFGIWMNPRTRNIVNISLTWHIYFESS